MARRSRGIEKPRTANAQTENGRAALPDCYIVLGVTESKTDAQIDGKFVRLRHRLLGAGFDKEDGRVIRLEDAYDEVMNLRGCGEDVTSDEEADQADDADEDDDFVSNGDDVSEAGSEASFDDRPAYIKKKAQANATAKEKAKGQEIPGHKAGEQTLKAFERSSPTGKKRQWLDAFPSTEGSSNNSSAKRDQKRIKRVLQPRAKGVHTEGRDEY